MATPTSDIHDQFEAVLITRRDGSLVVRLDGEIDCANADRLTRAVRQAVDRQPTFVQLDMSSVTFFDCAGVRALQVGVDAAAQANLPIRLYPASRQVARLLDLAEADRWLHWSAWAQLSSTPAGLDADRRAVP